MRRLVAVACAATLSATIAPGDAAPDSTTAVAGATAPPGTGASGAPARDLPAPPQHETGQALFRDRWVVAPSPFGRWGRGPTSSAEACTDCHAGGGGGSPPVGDADDIRSMVVHLSLPGTDAAGGPLPHPAYGLQIQTQGTLGVVPPEARVTVHWQAVPFRWPDGTIAMLRKPEIRLHDLAFGPPGEDTLFSLRIAPPLAGVGLLAAIPGTAIEATAGGHPNRVPARPGGPKVTGRFGWKAGQPSLAMQVARAFHEDLGVTTPIFPRDNCPAPQTACAAAAKAGPPELGQAQLDALVAYLGQLGEPRRQAVEDGAVRRGGALFGQSGCAACHRPAWTLTTDDRSPGGDRVIRPYTDLLLHDMGPDLADGRPEFDAGPAEWRTAPLWGMAQRRSADGHVTLLHDGRARDIVEAILWHGGEAAGARLAFTTLAPADRAALVAFVESL